MAELVADGPELWLRLRPAEKVVAFHRDVRVPLTAVVRIRTPPSGWAELRGWRSTGVALYGRSAKGMRRHGTGWDFTALAGDGPVVVVELNGARFERLVVTVEDAATTARELAAAAGIAWEPPAG